MLFPKDIVLCNPKKPNEDICREIDGAFSVPGAQCQCCCASEGSTCRFCKKTIGWHECPKMNGPFTPGNSKLRWKPGSLWQFGKQDIWPYIMQMIAEVQPRQKICDILQTMVADHNLSQEEADSLIRNVHAQTKGLLDDEPITIVPNKKWC